MLALCSTGVAAEYQRAAGMSAGAEHSPGHLPAQVGAPGGDGAGARQPQAAPLAPVHWLQEAVKARPAVPLQLSSGTVSCAAVPSKCFADVALQRTPPASRCGQPALRMKVHALRHRRLAVCMQSWAAGEVHVGSRMPDCHACRATAV